MTNHRRTFLHASLLALLLAGAIVTGRADPVAAPKPDGQLKVLSYNIHHGRGSDGKIDLARIAEVIKASGAHLVALQEVDNKTGRSQGVDQAAELGKLTGMHAVFGKAIDFSGGEYGGAVLSKFPIKAKMVIPLPTAAGKENRVAVLVEVEVEGERLSFAGTHLSHEKDSARERIKAFSLIRDAVRESGGSANAILAGDLNAGPQSEEIRKLREHWTLIGDKNDLPTWPAENPRIRIDYICLAKGSKLTPKELQVIEEKIASDHRPVLATLEVPSGIRGNGG